MVPFLPNLTAIRLLGNPDDPTFLNQMREMDERGVHERKIGEETRNREWSKLRYMELGADDLIFEIGGTGGMGEGRKERVEETGAEEGFGLCGGHGYLEDGLVGNLRDSSVWRKAGAK